jgi:hypothetical protein
MKRFSIIASLTAIAMATGAVSAQASCYQPLKGNAMVSTKTPLMPLPYPHFGARANNTQTDSIVGLWHAVHKVNGKLFFQSWDQWHEDGTEIEDADIPPTTGNMCLGVWQQTGRDITLYHVAWTYDIDGKTPTGTLVLTATDRVSSDGSYFKGPFEAKFYDPKGNLVNDLKGETTATRITTAQQHVY